MPLSCVTFSGIDHTISRDDIEVLQTEMYRPGGRPAVEFAVLDRGPKVAGKNRYPTREWHSRTMLRGHSSPLRPRWSSALHLCDGALWDVHGHQFWERLERFDRVQLNFGITAELIADRKKRAEIKRIVDWHGNFDPQVILQVTDVRNQDVLDAAVELAGPGGQILLDPSRGGLTGRTLLDELTNTGVHLASGVTWGFAGKVGYANFEDVMWLAASLTSDGWFWIDMESSLRDADDNFCPQKVMSIFHLAAAYTTATNPVLRED